MNALSHRRHRRRGATPETGPAEFEEMETPHFMNGMVEEFTVEP